MSNRMKSCLLLGVLGYALLAALVFFFAGRSRDHYASSPTTSRDVDAFREGTFGLLEPSERKTRVEWPALERMVDPVRIEGADAAFALEWPGEAEGLPKTAPERWIANLANGESVDLVAFATWTPQADDPVESPADWDVPLTLRDPTDARALSNQEIDALGMPPGFLRLTPPSKYPVPILRLVFRTSGMEHPRAPKLVAGDARTGAQVSYDLQKENDGSPRQETVGKWVRIDTDLLLWHDTPLTCHVQFLSGPAEFAELPLEPGAQIAFGDRLRLQTLALTDSAVSASTSTHGFQPAPHLPAEEQLSIRERIRSANRSSGTMVVAKPDPESPANPHLLARASSRDYLTTHCGLVESTGVIWAWSTETSSNAISIGTIPFSDPPVSPARLVFVPHLAELTYSLPSLPDMANPRETEDLFDLVLPRITLPEDPDDAESHLLGYIGVATQFEWEKNNRWKGSLPPALPADRTFRNTTPRALLDWYLENTPGSWVRYDEEDFVIHFNEEAETDWWDGVKAVFSRIFLGH